MVTNLGEVLAVGVGAFLGILLAQRVAFVSEIGRQHAAQLIAARAALEQWQRTFERATVAKSTGQAPATYTQPSDVLPELIVSMERVQGPSWRRRLILRSLIVLAGDETLTVLRIGPPESNQAQGSGMSLDLKAKVFEWWDMEKKVFEFLTPRPLRILELDPEEFDNIRADIACLRSSLTVKRWNLKERQQISAEELPAGLKPIINELLR